MSTRSNTRPPALPALTGLRFLAAAAVFLFHFGAAAMARAGLPPPLVRFFQNGYLGVSLFFILSGFIMTYAHRNDRIDLSFLRNFFLSRFARLYPVYILALLLALPTLSGKANAPAMASVLLMVQSWTSPVSSAGYYWVMQAWTLSVEVFFYLCFPLLMLASRCLSLRGAALLAIFCAILIVTFGLSSVAPGAGFIPHMHTAALPIPVLRLAEFTYGMMLAHLSGLRPQLGPALGGTCGELATAAAIIACMSASRDTCVLGLASLLFGLLILQLAAGTGVLSAILSKRPLLLLGGASYALYLLQGPVHALCMAYIPDPFGRIFNPLVTLCGAILTFLFWEQPWLRTIQGAYKSRAARRSRIDRTALPETETP